MGGWHWKRLKCEGFGRSYEDLYNIGTEEQVAVHLCGFDGVRRGNYFGGEPTDRRTEVEVRVDKLRNGKAAGKDEVTGKMTKGWGGLDLEAV